MTGEVLSIALPRLRRSLGLGAQADELLTAKLELAEEEILRYLNRDELPDCAQSLLVELAGLRYLQSQCGGKKGESYAEGQISQSESYYTPGEFREGVDALLRTLAPYRRVGCKGAAK